MDQSRIITDRNLLIGAYLLRKVIELHWWGRPTSELTIVVKIRLEILLITQSKPPQRINIEPLTVGSRSENLFPLILIGEYPNWHIKSFLHQLDRFLKIQTILLWRLGNPSRFPIIKCSPIIKSYPKLLNFLQSDIFSYNIDLLLRCHNLFQNQQDFDL